MSISSSGIYNNIGENTRKSLNFAIVGCGQIGARHALHIQNSGTLVAVCDILSERSGELGEKYGALSYTNLEEMIAAHPEIDVLAVCTPNGLHAQHSILALKAGLHVICEKPMALSVRDCEQMIRAAEDAGKNLFIVKQNRFNPPVAAVKKLADQGKLGKIFSLQANCFWNRGPSYYENSWRGSK
ncbi:MAG TPA: Gfo/Idh/MocA family oxidoreductase, partial [Parasegetibacter sp.]